jgi:hypothetical protein
MVDPNKIRDVLNGSHQSMYIKYVHQSILKFTKISKPITELWKKGTKYVWSEACDEAFQTLKKMLTTSHVLA